MALLSDYTAGTVSVAANGTIVTGTGTAWQVAQFQEGDWFIANGFVSIVASVDSNTTLTLVSGWQGGALSGAAYRLRYMSDGSRASAQARQLIDLLGGSGNVQALAGLAFAADMLIKTTGPGTAELIDLTAVIPDRLSADGELYDDWNAIPWEFGRYRINNGAPNGPFSGFGVVLSIPMASIGNEAGFQIASTLTNGAGGILYYRSRNDATGGYSPWRSLIPESGSNANGYYVRHPDGTQICTMTRTSVAGAPATFTWPAAFIDANYVVTAGALSGAPTSISSVKISNKTPNTVDLLLTAFVSGSVTAPGGAGMDVTAIGRWF